MFGRAFRFLNACPVALAIALASVPGAAFPGSGEPDFAYLPGSSDHRRPEYSGGGASSGRPTRELSLGEDSLILRAWAAGRDIWLDEWRRSHPIDTASTVRALRAWQARAEDGGTIPDAQAPVPFVPSGAALPLTAVLPNATVWAATPEHHNASLSFNELPANGTEAYAVFTEMTGTIASATRVMQARSGAGGAPATWALLGSGPPLAGAIPPYAFADQWNPTIASHPAGGFWEAHVEFVRPPAPLVGSAPSVIVVGGTPGGGTPFPGVSPAIPGGAPGPGSWVDFPFVIVNDVAGNPGPPGKGDLHLSWLEYHDLDGDPDGNGVFFDDPADSFRVVTASSNTMLFGPVQYPAFSAPTVVLRGAVWPGGHQTHRPSMAVAGPAGTAVVGPGGVYLAAVDAVAGQIVIAAAASPGVVPGWVSASGPTPVAITSLPSPATGAVRKSSSVTIAVDNGPTTPARVYIAWSDYGAGDADILFRASADGGATWQGTVRVNQDTPGNGRDQWAPHLVVHPVSGALHISYFDQRGDPSGTGTETWTSTSLDGGLTWTDTPISDAGATPPVGSIAIPPGIYIGDYLFSDVNALNAFGAIWSDGRGGVDQDVFFGGVPVTPGDADGDGVPDSLDNCPAAANSGQADSDSDGHGDACDVCVGFDDFADADGDGVPDGCDVCPGGDDLADADADGVPDACDICPGGDDLADTDADGVPDGCDVCPGGDDLADADADGVPDGCDVCPGGDDLADADADGVPDACDICPGGDDLADADADGVPDACDICPGGDDLADADADGVPDGCDVCPGGDDLQDTDADGTPDACDGCPADSAKIAPGLCGCDAADGDSDGDGSPDCLDICPGFDDLSDDDGDLVADSCDNCPAVFNADQGTTIALTGDANQDGVITSADIIYMVNFIFKSGFKPDPCEGVGDVNCSGNVTSADIIFLVNYTFKGGSPPCDICETGGLGWSCP